MLFFDVIEMLVYGINEAWTLDGFIMFIAGIWADFAYRRATKQQTLAEERRHYFQIRLNVNNS